MLTTFERDNFAKVTGSSFTLTAGPGQSIDVELAEVSPLKEAKHQRSFSIVFLVPETFRVEQGLYDLAHPELGEMQLFLVPVGMRNSRQELEAVFNLLLEQEA
jgi:hypothetical protein